MKRKRQEHHSRLSGEAAAHPPSLLFLWTPARPESDRFLATSLTRNIMLIQGFTGLGLEEASTTVKGETHANFPTETSVPSSSANVGTEQCGRISVVVVIRKLPSAPQEKNQPILSGYNQSSIPFKRREPKSCFLNSCPLLPKPEHYPSPRGRYNSA